MLCCALPGIFLGAVMARASDEQKNEWFKKIINLEMVGAYAQVRHSHSFHSVPLVPLAPSGKVLFSDCALLVVRVEPTQTELGHGSNVRG